MKKSHLLSIALLASLSARAQNPFVQTLFTADPAPMVYKDVLYAFVGHDEDDAADRSYKMKDYRCYTTTDMVNWTDHGVIIDIKTVFKWSGGDANAAQCIERNGKWYYYVSTGCTLPNKGGVAVGVAVADNPFGPYTDALGKPLVSNDQTKAGTHSWDDLDPTIFIDDDGKAYLYWGNNACYYAQLNDDLISLKGEIGSILQTDKDAFGQDFEEAPWFYKRNGNYYLIYASQFPEFTRYAMSKSPLGPWTYKGTIMQKPLETGLGTNHCGVVDYKGNSYFFYHNAALPKGGDKRRSACVAQFKYNDDGTIPEIPYNKEGVKPVGKLNPFQKNEAETIAWAQGVRTAKNDKTGMYVTEIHNGDFIKVREVDFDKGATKFTASVAAEIEGASIQIRIDSEVGPIIGTLNIKPTGGQDKWESQSCAIEKAKETHDLFFRFVGPENKPLFNFDSWQFEK